MTWRNGFLVDKGMHSVGVFGLMYVSYCSNIKAIFAGNKKCTTSFCIRTLRKVVHTSWVRVLKNVGPRRAGHQLGGFLPKSSIEKNIIGPTPYQNVLFLQ
jgi:hypothetical protein